MLNIHQLKVLLGFGICFLLLQSALASATEISKDDWLKKLKDIAPTMICKGFLDDEAISKQMKVQNIDDQKCIALIPASFDKCQTENYANIPNTMNRESGSTWGHTMGECIGRDFAVQYLYPTKSDVSKPAPADAVTPAPVAIETPAQINSTQDMAKDAWLAQLKMIAPGMICKGFLEEDSLKAKLTEKQIDNAKCLSLIPESFDKCQAQYYTELPATISSDTASTWGHKIGECIGTDFAVKFLTH